MAFPKQHSRAGIDQPGKHFDRRVTADHPELAAVLLQCRIEDGIGTYNLPHLYERRPLHLACSRQAVLFHNLIDEREGKDVVTAFRDGLTQRSIVTVRRLEVVGLIDRWKDKNR